MWTECNSLLMTIEELELSLIDKADLEIEIKQLLGSVCDDKCLDKCLCAYCVNRRHLFIESSQTWFSCTTSDHSSVNHCPPYSLTGTWFLEMLPCILCKASTISCRVVVLELVRSVCFLPPIVGVTRWPQIWAWALASVVRLPTSLARSSSSPEYR